MQDEIEAKKLKTVNGEEEEDLGEEEENIDGEEDDIEGEEDDIEGEEDEGQFTLNELVESLCDVRTLGTTVSVFIKLLTSWSIVWLTAGLFPQRT